MKLLRSSWDPDRKCRVTEDLEIPEHALIAQMFCAGDLTEVTLRFSDGPTIRWRRPSSPPSIGGSATAPLIEG